MYYQMRTFKLWEYKKFLHNFSTS